MAVSKKTKSEPGAHKALRKLKQENESLRRTIGDVFEMLQSVDSSAPKKTVWEANLNACRCIVVDLPDVYSATSKPARLVDESEITARQFAVLTERIERKIADAMGIPRTELKGASVDDRLIAWRKVLVATEGPGMRKVPADFRSPFITQEELEAMVQINFNYAVGLAAQIPCSLRAEGKRYIGIVNKILSPIPQRRRKGAADVTKAVELLKMGKTPESICRKVIPGFRELPFAAQRSVRRDLIKKARGVIRAARSYTNKKAKTS